jgi:hypothetical protein
MTPAEDAAFQASADGVADMGRDRHDRETGSGLRSESPASVQESHALGRVPDILARMTGQLAETGLAGEERAAALVYLCMTSRLLERPVSLVLKAPSSAGKSYLVKRVLELFPPSAYHAVTAMSERAIAYGREPLSHRILVLYEAAGMQGDWASYLIRSLLSEGVIRYETVDPKTHQVRLMERAGPTGLIVTTTAIQLHPENETRLRVSRGRQASLPRPPRCPRRRRMPRHRHRSAR